MLKKQFQILCVLLLCGVMQTDYVWDVWDFGFITAGAVMLGLVLFGNFER